MAEETEFCKSREDARNRALAWLEARGGAWGGDREVTTNRFPAADRGRHENGVATRSSGAHRSIREEWDSGVGPHFNAEVGRGEEREKRRFVYPLESKDLPALTREAAYDPDRGVVGGYAGSPTAGREQAISDGMLRRQGRR